MPDPTPVTEEQQELPIARTDLEALRADLKSDNEKLAKQLAGERDARVRLEARATERKPPETSKAKTYTEPELQALVDAGNISESTRSDILRRQDRDSHDQRTDAKIKVAVTASQASQSIQTEIDRYTAGYPEVLEEGSDTRNRVQEEFNYLVRMGRDAEELATQLQAMRSALGPAERIGEVTRERRPVHAEAGGSGGGSDAPASSDNPVPKPLRDNPKMKFHYDALIRQGMYTGYDDPVLVREMKFVRPSGRAS